MEAVVLCGLQGSGKTTLYRERFLDTHVRISMDLLHTRGREADLLDWCLRTHTRFVVDNTNPTAADRARYVGPARGAGFRVIGYLVDASPDEALARNADARKVPGTFPARRAPDRAVAATARRLLRPTPEEGFDELWHAAAAPGGGFRIEPLTVTPPLF